jgi:DNA phosphorothioation-associated DGQHR protein 1
MISYPYKTPVLLVEQPIGSFYVAILPADLLLGVCYSDALSASYDEETRTYRLDGTQRLHQPKRLEPIAEFIDRIDAVFPNTIIIAANQRKEDGLTEDSFGSEDDTADRDPRWEVSNERTEDGREVLYLTIPTPKKLAAIIDGQHRLFAFTHATPDRRTMSLVCSIFIDLPKPYQAQIFATINSNQKPVDKSLTFELFGYNISEEPSKHWSPDKLAVFISRKLATEEKSPLRGRIIIAPRQDQKLRDLGANQPWKVSTAVIVNGIMRLYTSNPKRDANTLQSAPGRERAQLGDDRRDRSPLRELYISGNDVIIYEIVKNYLTACNHVFWESAGSDSYIVRTVGVQALFDILKSNVARLAAEKDVSVGRFVSLLSPAGSINFAHPPYKNPSGSGRSAIRKALQEAIS